MSELCFDCSLLPPRGQKQTAGWDGVESVLMEIRGKAAEKCEDVDEFVLTPRQL